MKSNIFTELLGSTGTTASAMLIMDLLKAKKFNNQRDAARTLTSIPFHIRRSNKQLVQQFKELLGSDQVSCALPYFHYCEIKILFFCVVTGGSCQDGSPFDLRTPGEDNLREGWT